MTLRIQHLLLLAALPLAAQSLDTPVLPDAAKNIQVLPDAHIKLKYHFVAVGKQIYKCDNGAWSKTSAPDAALYDKDSNLVAHHTAGPTWTMVDGSGAIRAVGGPAVHFAPPDGASIDWLRLDADKASRTGVFSDVAIIQRLYTGLGKASSSSCSAGEVDEVPYTAHYYFWSMK
ncbi:MAG: DUF3455 domain-containing protein [Bryobacteraceae bacterium]|jgi:hypothetical protein